MTQNGKIALAIGIVTGVAAATVGCIAAFKIVNEIKEDFQETTLISPNEKNFVTVKCGSSKFARGLTLVKVKAENETDTCNISFLAGKNSNKIRFNWKDDDHFEFHLGDGKVKQHCDVSFAGESISMKYSLKKSQPMELKKA